MRYMPRRTLYTYACGAICLVCLAGCAGPFASATPTPTATSTPTATADIIYAQQTPNITCDDALQLIEQLQVNKVIIYTDDQNELVAIDVFVANAPTPTSTAGGAPSLVPPGDNAINPLTTRCESQVLAAVKQTNKRLPASAQIQVQQLKTYN